MFHDKEYTLTETRPADGYVTADAITYQIKSVMASSVAEDPTDTVASGSAVTVNPVMEVQYTVRREFLIHL